MTVETKAGWQYAVRQLDKKIDDSGGGGGEDVTVDSIVDAGSVGKEVMKAATQAEARDAIGATQNQTDTYLLNRANHTGTQGIDTVAGLQDQLNDLAARITALEGA